MIGLYREVVVSVKIRGRKYQIRRVIPASLPLQDDLRALDDALSTARLDIIQASAEWE